MTGRIALVGMISVLAAALSMPACQDNSCADLQAVCDNCIESKKTNCTAVVTVGNQNACANAIPIYAGSDCPTGANLAPQCKLLLSNCAARCSSSYAQGECEKIGRAGDDKRCGVASATNRCPGQDGGGPPSPGAR